MPNFSMNFDDMNISAQVGDIVYYSHSSSAPTPAVGAYISFAKNKRVNTSSLVGYYASVNFVNNSTNKVELFGVGSEITISSK